MSFNSPRWRLHFTLTVPIVLASSVLLVVTTANADPGASPLAGRDATVTPHSAKRVIVPLARQLAATSKMTHRQFVIGLPGYDHGAGAVEVRSGSSGTGATLLRQGSGGIAGPRRAGDGFGAATLAFGFSGGHEDLAIGIPGLTVAGVKGAGGVQILYGSAKGFSVGPLITRRSSGVPGSLATSDHFGASLAGAPVVDSKGLLDSRAVSLLVGVPGAAAPEASGEMAPGAGEIVELDYTRPGSTVSPPAQSFLYYQGHGVAGAPVTEAHLGAVLGYVDDLPAAGAPSETVHGKADAGFWGNLYLPGAPATPSNFQDFDFAGTAADERLGAGFGYVYEDPDDVIDLVGAPGATVAGHAGAGKVMTYIFSTNGEDGVRVGRPLTQNTASMPGKAAADAHFGAALGSATTGSGGFAFIGAPGEWVGRHAGAGAVTEISYEPTFVAQLLTQAGAGTPGIAEAADHFGQTIATIDATNTARFVTADLLVGVPGENLGKVPNAGAVNLYPITSTGVAKTGRKILTPKPPAKGDEFGGGRSATNDVVQ